MKLYELTGEIAEVMAMVEAGELSQHDVADTLEALDIEVKAKAVSVAHYMLNLNPMIDALDAEIKRLQERKFIIKNRQDSLKDYLRSNMERCDISKIVCDLFTITKRKPVKVAVIDDEDSIPAGYFIEVPATRKLDKKALLKDLKEKQVQGAHLEDGKASILIK